MLSYNLGIIAVSAMMHYVPALLLVVAYRRWRGSPLLQGSLRAAAYTSLGEIMIMLLVLAALAIPILVSMDASTIFATTNPRQ